MGFASFLHNPYGYPTDVERAAMLCFRRKQRFVQGYDSMEHLDSILLKHFHSLDVLYRDGLNMHFKELRLDVIQNHLIGLILQGADKSIEDKKFYDYTTSEQNTISLTRQSICANLLENYMKADDIDELCRKTPNFNIYYDNTD